MNRTALIVCLCAAALPVHASAQVSAEPWFRAGTWMITVEVGGAAFSDFERTHARPVGADPGTGDFARRVSARTSASAGAWASYWIANGWGLRAGFSYVPSSFTVWNDVAARRALNGGVTELSAAEDPGFASLDVWMANGSVVFRFPHNFGRVVPYGIAGAGLVRYAVSGNESIPPEARGRFEEGTYQTAAGMFGIGAVIPLQRNNLLMSFELTNHLSRTPLGNGNEGETFELDGVLMEIGPGGGMSGEDDVGLTSHVRLALGLTLPIR
jgi:opacity protein-like surface antigen